jgi:hypothetical protein
LEIDSFGGGFQTGYLMRFVVDYLEEVRALGDWQAYAEGFSYLSGLMEWNLHYGNFPYYFDARAGGEGSSSGTGLTLVDPQAWYYWHTGKQAYGAQLTEYLSTGINGGETPYGNFTDWRGQFEGRYYLYVQNTVRTDMTPPPPISDLAGTRLGSKTYLRWTPPVGAVRYQLVWSTKPIVEEPSTSSSVINWWAANPIGTGTFAETGTAVIWSIDTGATSPVYVAVFSFDASDNMSRMSNVVATQPSEGGVFMVR